MGRLFRFIAVLVVGLAAGAARADQAIPDMVLGNPDAPVTIIEYSSLTCPHCAAFHKETLPRIKREWIDTGKAKLVFRDFPFEGVGLGAAMVARCVGPERYFAFLDTLFATQQQWAYSKNPLTALKNTAKLAGISDDRFQACLSDQRTATAIQAKQKQAQEKWGINSTPSFVIDGELVKGAQPYAEFEKVLARAAGK